MQKTALRFQKTGLPLNVSDLSAHIEEWLLDDEIRQHFPQTLAMNPLSGKRKDG